MRAGVPGDRGLRCQVRRPRHVRGRPALSGGRQERLPRPEQALASRPTRRSDGTPGHVGVVPKMGTAQAAVGEAAASRAPRWAK